MNRATRSIIVLLCCGVCVVGMISSWQATPGERQVTVSETTLDFESNYQFAVNDDDIRNRRELETAIILKTPKTPCKRIEIGSVRLDRGMALVPVFFFSFYDEVEPVVYKLVPTKNSWKVISVQRLWFVPASQIARGLRV